MCTKSGRERRGKKREINSSEANTVPNSQLVSITLILAGGSLLFHFV